MVDISHPNFEEHIESVNQILKDISLDKPTLFVFNKIDLYESDPWDETDLVEREQKIIIHWKSGKILGCTE